MQTLPQTDEVRLTVPAFIAVRRRRWAVMHCGHVRLPMPPPCWILLALLGLVQCGGELPPFSPLEELGIPVSVRAKADREVFAALSRGESRDLLISLNQDLIERLAVAAGRPPIPNDPHTRLAAQSVLLRQTAEDLVGLQSQPGRQLLQDYNPIPVLFVRLQGLGPLIALLKDARVLGAETDQHFPLLLQESLPMIGEPQAAALGYTGRGVAVAVLDTGVEPSLDPRFGGCPGAGCRVSQADIAPDDAVADDCYDPAGHGSCHGTNVSAIVLGVAPAATLINLDVFQWTKDGLAGASSHVLLRAYQRIIQAQQTGEYSFAAVNMSLGSPAGSCPDEVRDNSRALRAAIATARSLGILTVAAAGNDGVSNAISAPACYPGVVSVGAVTDTPGAEDQIASFSNSAVDLTLLAPGATITAGMVDPSRLVGGSRVPLDGMNIRMQGTSQATPHVAGAVAVLKSAFPWLGLDEIVECLQSSGIPIRDARNGLVRSRLNLYAAVTECYGTCYARCCDTGNTLLGPTRQKGEAACRDWGASACGSQGAIRVEYNGRSLLSVGAQCGEECRVRCCDGFLAGPNYFKTAASCSDWRADACIGHGGPARVDFGGTRLPPDETKECAQRCEVACCDGTSTSTTSVSQADCVARRPSCEGRGGAVGVTFGGVMAWTGNGRCDGTCSARCCNGSTESIRVSGPRQCHDALFCQAAGVGGATRTVFRPDRAKHAGFPVNNDVACVDCGPLCCDGSRRSSPYAEEALCRRDSDYLCQPAGATYDITFGGRPLSGTGAKSCVVAYARCCDKDDPGDFHGHLAGPYFAKDGAMAETMAGLQCSGKGGAIRLQVDDRYWTPLKATCGTNAYADCKMPGGRIGPLSYLDCRKDLMTLIGELKHECSSRGGLETVDYAGKTVWDRGTESCP